MISVRFEIIFLQEVLHNEAFNLTNEFRISIASDIAKVSTKYQYQISRVWILDNHNGTFRISKIRGCKGDQYLLW